GVSSTIKADVNLKSMIGKTSGEEIQIAFSGQGWVLIQPSEGRVKAATTSTNTQSQAADALGGLFNR
ncbi:MAG: AIM24 family protein, partial [Solirubrobacterales bacterium]